MFSREEAWKVEKQSTKNIQPRLIMKILYVKRPSVGLAGLGDEPIGPAGFGDGK